MKNQAPVNDETQKKKKSIEHWKVIAFYLLIYDIVAVNASYFAGLWLRFDLQFSHIPSEHLRAFLKFSPVYTVFVLVIFNSLRLYNSLWRFASFSELNRIFAASVITALFHTVTITLLFGRMPASYYIIGAILQCVLITGVRFSYRYITLIRVGREQSAGNTRNVMVIGAGAAGQVILKELKGSKELASKPRCVIDDNSNKWGRFIEDVPLSLIHI